MWMSIVHLSPHFWNLDIISKAGWSASAHPSSLHYPNNIPSTCLEQINCVDFGLSSVQLQRVTYGPVYTPAGCGRRRWASVPRVPRALCPGLLKTALLGAYKRCCGSWPSFSGRRDTCEGQGRFESGPNEPVALFLHALKINKLVFMKCFEIAYIHRMCIFQLD